MSWLAEQHPQRLFVSVITIGEFRRGVLQLAKRDETKARSLGKWVNDLAAEHADRLLPVDEITAKIWAELSATKSRPLVDTMLAATALANDLTLVTRNTKDFDFYDLRVVNPFEPAST